MSQEIRQEDNKSSYSFDVQIELEPKKKEYGFDDFADFGDANANDQSFRSSIDEPQFDPKELMKQKSQSNTSSQNPFVSDSVSNPNQSQQPTNPFVSKTPSEILEKNQVKSTQEKRTQMTFGEAPQPTKESHFKAPSPKNTRQSNFFTFKRGNSTAGLSSIEILADSIQSTKAEIQSYKQAIDKQNYESVKMAERQVEMAYVVQKTSDRLAQISKQVYERNRQMQQKTVIQQQITKTYLDVCSDRQKLIQEIRQGLGCDEEDNPTEEEKALYLELENISKKIKGIEEQEEELRLSRLLGSLTPVEKPAESNNLAQFVYEMVQKHGYPNLSYNVKLSCLKNRWILMETAEIQVGLIYDKSDDGIDLEIHIGNKLNKELQQFTLLLKDESQPTYDKETLLPKSYMKIPKRSSNIFQGYLHTLIGYQLQEKKKEIELAIPIVFLHFGQFEPATTNSIAKKWKSVESVCKSMMTVIDKDIIASYMDVKKYFCSLIEIKGKKMDRQLAGIFQFSCGNAKKQEVIIKFKGQEDHMSAKIGSVAGPNGEVMSKETLNKMLQALTFIFCI